MFRSNDEETSENYNGVDETVIGHSIKIEGDLVSLVTEVIDREVTLPDLLTELTTAQVATTPRLPTGCRFWIR